MISILLSFLTPIALYAILAGSGAKVGAILDFSTRNAQVVTVIGRIVAFTVAFTAAFVAGRRKDDE